MIDAARWQWVLVECGVKPSKAADWAPVFERHCQPERFSLGGRELDDFLGQTLYETNALRVLEENLDYSAARIRELALQFGLGTRWRSLGPLAEQIAHNPEAMAEAAYGGRLGNGPPGSGDGWKYRGSGIPMVTGKANYLMLQEQTKLPLVAHPDLLRQPNTALLCGILWWEGHVPDTAIDSLERVTRAVSGGTLGLPDRAVYTERARTALKGYL